MVDWLNKLFSEVSLLVSLALHRARGSFRNNVGMWLLALGLSVGLWVLVSNEQNPPKTDTFPSDIPVKPVNVPQNLDILGGVEPVRVRITAPLDLWSRLSASNFKATADLSGAGPGVQEVVVRAESTNSRVEVLEVIPRKIKVQLEALKKQVVPVRVNFQDSVPFGYTFDPPKLSVEQVTILGPEPLVNQVDSAVADVNLGGVTVNINQSHRLTPRTRRGYEIKGVTLEPDSVVVQVTVRQQLLYQSYAVSPRLKGNVAQGYWVSSASVEPAMVTVVGTTKSLQAINFLQTKEVDISGIASNISRPVGIELPEGVSLVGLETVTMRVAVVPAQGTRVFRVVPQTKGLASGLKVSFLTDSVEVTVSGDVLALNRLLPTEVSPTIDLSNLRPSIYYLTPQAPVLKDIKVINIEPKEIGVVIN